MSVRRRRNGARLFPSEADVVYWILDSRRHIIQVCYPAITDRRPSAAMPSPPPDWAAALYALRFAKLGPLRRRALTSPWPPRHIRRKWRPKLHAPPAGVRWPGFPGFVVYTGLQRPNGCIPAPKGLWRGASPQRASIGRPWMGLGRPWMQGVVNLIEWKCTPTHVFGASSVG